MILPEYLATHAVDEQHIFLRPDANQPVVNEHERQTVLEQQAIIVEVNELLKTAHKADQKRLERYREEAEHELAISERRQWIISIEARTACAIARPPIPRAHAPHPARSGHAMHRDRRNAARAAIPLPKTPR